MADGDSVHGVVPVALSEDEVMFAFTQLVAPMHTYFMRSETDPTRGATLVLRLSEEDMANAVRINRHINGLFLGTVGEGNVPPDEE
jgi:hypothetical protein